MIEAVIAVFVLLAFAIVLSGGKVDVESHHAFELARFHFATRAVCFVVVIFAILVLALNAGEFR